MSFTLTADEFFLTSRSRCLCLIHKLSCDMIAVVGRGKVTERHSFRRVWCVLCTSRMCLGSCVMSSFNCLTLLNDRKGVQLAKESSAIIPTASALHTLINSGNVGQLKIIGQILTYSSFCKFSNLIREKTKFCHLISLKILRGFGWKDEFARERVWGYIVHIGKVINPRVKNFHRYTHIRLRRPRIYRVRLKKWPNTKNVITR